MINGLIINKLDVKSDERGWLVEILRKENLQKEKGFGQIFVTVAKPGVTKGNHYHKRKHEWFCVIRGKGKLLLKDITSDESQEVLMGDENMVVVKIPPNVTHAIKNIGDEMLYLLIYIDEPFDQQDPDTFPCKPNP
ncbi:MAG TPA: WxcM-like domain-containing protein [Nitrospinota bacterium]|nr:WxcM-like domain-containing protein [Nitrospinota bacterium]|tara:strand:- start:24 stop:431 length:408 start_codon:yes stop_codon:yes gene_type:complete